MSDTIEQYLRPNVLAMRGYVPGEQPRGGKFIKLNTNELPYPPSPAVRESILAAIDRGLQTYPDPMATSARQAVGSVLGVPPDWVLCGNGSDDLLTIITRAFLGEGRTLRMPYPSYVLYRSLAELQAARVDEVHFQPDWTLDEESFCRPDPSLALTIIPNPNSPSGTVVSVEQFERVARRLRCPLVIDEAYVDFADEDCIELVRRHPHVIVTRTLSKSYGLAGLRFGYLVAQPDVIQQLAKVKDSYNCDALSIAGAVGALMDRAWLAEHRDRVRATRRRLAEGMRDLGFDVPDSQGNFVWCTHTGHEVQPLYEQLKARQILVRYMAYNGWPPGLRISVGADQQVDALLRVLGELMGTGANRNRS